MANKPFNVRGTRYRWVVMKVLTQDEFGRPRTWEALYDEETTHLKGGEHFWILAAPEDMCKPIVKGQA